MKMSIRLRGTASLAAIAVAMSATGASAQAIIDNGTVQLGINPEGNLVVPGSGSPPVGLTYVPNKGRPGAGEALGPGCACEGWGIADLGTDLFGKAGESFGTANIDPTSVDLTVTGTGTAAGSTGSAARSVVNVVEPGAGGRVLRVTHDFKTIDGVDNLYRVDVTVKNITATAAGDVARLIYRRAMDWDIPPTQFSEVVTLQGWPASKLIASSNNGFADGNPNTPQGDIAGTGAAVNGNFTNAGPSDHGAVFDFDFGSVPAGEEITFTIYYGAAGNEAEALDALKAVGAEIYSLGKPRDGAGSDAEAGTPNTFIFAFAGVGGTPIGGGGGGGGPTIGHANAFRQMAFAMAREHMRLVSQRLTGLSHGGEGLEHFWGGANGMITALTAPLAQLAAADSDGGVRLAQLARSAANVSDDGAATAQARNMGGIDGLRSYITASYTVGEIDGTRASGETVDYDAINLVGGIDYEVLRDEAGFDSLLLGAGIGYGSYDGKIDNTDTRIDTSGYTAMLYGSATFAKSAYADITLAHSWLDYDYTRDAGASDLTATPDGREWGGTLRVGYDVRPRVSRFSPTRWVFGPFIQGQYLKAEIDGFTEQGPGGITFADQTAKSVTSQVGMHAAVMRSTDWGALVFSGRMAWEHEYEDGADQVRLSSGTARIDKVDPNYARLEVGMTALVGSGIAVTADYATIAGDTYRQEHTGRLRLRLGF